MHIRIIHPDAGFTEEELLERAEKMKQVSRPDTQVSFVCPKGTNIYIDSNVDIAIDGPELLKLAKEAEAEGIDAIGIYCSSDPVLSAIREQVSIPVLGAGQVSVSVALLLGERFAFITTSEERVSSKWAYLRQLGIAMDRIASVCGMSESVENTREALLAVGEQVVKDGADVIVLGCLAYNDYVEELQSALGVPVVHPAYALINQLELLVLQQLSHSKKTYPSPKKKERIWSQGSI
ncbi:aspartate/glutamate racemase family protein [Niallia sp. 03133]|uniref:aspartate/glutamate racemase family protein n=1 Tax=Niallia sp. 03133 TaxID=3458060 RepID=UPI004044110A